MLIAQKTAAKQILRGQTESWCGNGAGYFAVESPVEGIRDQFPRGGRLRDGFSGIGFDLGIRMNLNQRTMIDNAPFP